MILWGSNIRTLTNSHEDEFTADAIAFDWLGQAAYAQIGMLTLLDRLRSNATNPPAPNFQFWQSLPLALQSKPD